MNDLTIINIEGKLLVDSREVADMLGKRHDHLLRDIQGYIGVLDLNPNLGAANFFIVSSYQDAQNQTRPCFLLTRKGCDMVANKMTGEKGVLFTAAYVTKFEEMEQTLKQQPMQIDSKFLFQIAAQLEEKEKQIQIMAPKAQFYDDVAGSKDAIEMANVAKVLAIKGYGRNNLFEFLRAKNILDKNNIPYQKYVDAGYFRVVEQKYTIPTGETKINIKTLVLQRGVDHIRKIIKEDKPCRQ